jgi:hypothetical protein
MRRIASELLAALLLLSVGLVAATPPAQATEYWNWDDPVVSIGGQTFSIVIGVWGDPAVVRRSIREADLTIVVPKGSNPQVLRTTNTYFRENVHFIEVPDVGAGRSKTVYVMVHFDTTATMPARLIVDGALKDEGSTHGVLYASFTLR